jgi:hypothetical protein
MIVFLTLCYIAVLAILIKLKIVPLNTFTKMSPVLARRRFDQASELQRERAGSLFEMDVIPLYAMFRASEL